MFGWLPVATPAWLFQEDHIWLNALIDDFARLDGRPYREVAAFLQEPPRRPAPTGKRRMATWTLQSLCRRERPPLDAAFLRGTLSVEAQRARNEGRFNRAQVLSAAAQRLGLPSEAVEAHMFADLPGEGGLGLPIRFRIRNRLQHRRISPWHKACSGSLPKSLSRCMEMRERSFARCVSGVSCARCDASSRRECASKYRDLSHCSAIRRCMDGRSHLSFPCSPGVNASIWPRSACCAARP